MYIMIKLYDFFEFFLNYHNIMDFKEVSKSLQQSIINEYGLHAPSYIFYTE
jgi:hypothetical protein